MILNNSEKTYIKAHILDYAEKNLEKSKGKSFCCPSCKSGHGANGTGALNVDERTYRFKCFSCSTTGDIFDLIGINENITDAAKQFERGAELYLGYETTQKTTPQSKENIKSDKYIEKNIKSLKNENSATEKAIEEQKKTLSEYMTICKSRVNQTNYFLQDRKISKETIERFNLGYDPDYKDPLHPEYQYGLGEAVIIPTTEDSFIVRLLNEKHQTNKTRKVKPSNARMPIFNIDLLKTATTPIFVVEGEMDALSLYSLETAELKDIDGNDIKEFNAVSIGGVSNAKWFANEIVNIKPKAPLILALDHDQNGIKAEMEIAEILRKGNVFFIGNEPDDQADNVHKFLYHKERLDNGEIEYFNDLNECLQNTNANDLKMKCYATLYQAQIKAKERHDLIVEEYARKNSAASQFDIFLEDIKENAKRELTKTGFRKFDKIIGGGMHDGLYFIGAGSSVGKTTFMLQVADQIAESGKDVLFFSLEMSRNELFAKSLSRLTRIIAEAHPYKQIQLAETTTSILRNEVYNKKDSEYARMEIEVFEKAKEEYRKRIMNHMYIYEGGGDIGVKQIREIVKQHVECTGSTPVVIVDYLQILEPYDNNSKLTDKQKTDKNVVELKILSRDFKTTVIGLASLNREAYRTGSANNGAVTQADFKESGGIEYSADVLIGIQGKDAGTGYYDEKKMREGKDGIRELKFVVLKNRNGAAYVDVTFKYDTSFNYYYEV